MKAAFSAVCFAFVLSGALPAAEFRIGEPTWQGTNLVFSIENPTPECPCNLLYATNLNPPIAWSVLVQGTAYQTNFTIPYLNTNQGFFQIRYKPLLQRPASLTATEDTLLSITNLQVTGFSGSTGTLSLAVSHGKVKFGVTNGLTFTAGTNNTASFSARGGYSSLSTALGNLTYLGSTNYFGSDTLNVSLSAVGTNASCIDGGSVPITISNVNDAPVAYPIEYHCEGSLYIPPPGVLTNCFDADGDDLHVIPRLLLTGNGGYLRLSADGSVSYVSGSSFATDFIDYQVYDTYSGGLHTTSAPVWLVIYSQPPPGTPPTVSLSSPTNGAIFTQGSNIDCSITITNPDFCQISYAEYYNGTNLIAEAFDEPYSFTWANAPPGTNGVYATLRSWCSSIVTTSAVVNVIVAPDSDGDGINDAQEVVNGTSASDYYNGIAPALWIVGGNFQSAAPSTTLPVLFQTLVTTTGGTIMNNAPVTFSVTQGGGLLAVPNSGVWQSNLTLRANSLGLISAQFQLPNLTNNSSFISASPGSYSDSSVIFVATSTNQVTSGSAYLDVYTPLK